MPRDNTGSGGPAPPLHRIKGSQVQMLSSRRRSVGVSVIMAPSLTASCDSNGLIRSARSRSSAFAFDSTWRCRSQKLALFEGLLSRVLKSEGHRFNHCQITISHWQCMLNFDTAAHASRGVSQTRRRATRVPQAGVSNGQPGSPLTTTGRRSRPGQGIIVGFPSSRRGFDSRHPLHSITAVHLWYAG